MRLVENGLDSFKKAYDKLCLIDNDYSDKIEYDLKDIILELHHSFEVLFKSLLHMKDHTLVFADLEKYYDNKFHSLINPNSKQSQGVHTITFIQAFKRIVVSSNIKIDSFYYQNILKFNDLRNSLTHSEVKIELSQIRILVANILFSTLPILESISEFKEYIENNSVVDKLKSITFIRDEWMLHSIIYLVNCKNQNEMEFREKVKYKKLLQDIGYVEREKSDDDYISENEYILNRFEHEFYSLGNFGYCKSKIDKSNIYIMELIVIHINVIELATHKIVKEKIASNLKALLSVFNGDNCDFTKNNFNELKHLYKQLGLYKKLYTGLNVQKISNILAQWENFMNVESKNKKLSNISIPYSFNKNSTINYDVYEYSENGNCKFAFSDTEYLKIMKALFDEDNIIFSLDSQFAQYVSTEIFDSVERYLSNDTWDFFWENLMGSWGNWGTVDNISEINCYGIDAICNIVNIREFTIWSEMEIGTEYYSDHEFYSDGSRYVYISLRVCADENGKIHLSDLKLLD